MQRQLQMVFGSHYLRPVKVTVRRDELSAVADRTEDENDSKSPSAVDDREVHVSIAGRGFCRATSEVGFNDAGLHETLSAEKVGIGRLRSGQRVFPPKMTRHVTGRTKDGAMRRYYIMEIE